MPRITCKTPASARPIAVRMADVTTSWATVAEAPDFSVPDTAVIFPARDPLDENRAIRPGEVFLLTPVKARNKSAGTLWVEAQILSENGVSFVMERIDVPAGDSVTLITQGLSLLKRNAGVANGDRLQVRAEAADAFDVTGAGQERPSSEHIGVVT